MFKANTLNSNFILLTAVTVLAASFMLSGRLIAPARDAVPVFFDDTTIVTKAAPVARTIDVNAIKVAETPMPKPVTIMPLPIIPPKVLFRVMPVYPFQALEKGTEGTVLLSVFIGSSGAPEKIVTKLSSGSSYLDSSAFNAVSQWKFSPAARGVEVLGCWFEVPVSFRIR
jgi:periplasmic protein TonB